MCQLSKEEKETIILYNQTNDPAFITTFDTDLKRRLNAFAQRYPAHCRNEAMRADDGYASYVIDKDRLSIRLIAPYSEARRKAASAYAKAHGFDGKKE